LGLGDGREAFTWEQHTHSGVELSMPRPKLFTFQMAERHRPSNWEWFSIAWEYKPGGECFNWEFALQPDRFPSADGIRLSKLFFSNV